MGIKDTFVYNDRKNILVDIVQWALISDLLWFVLCIKIGQNLPLRTILGLKNSLYASIYTCEAPLYTFILLTYNAMRTAPSLASLY